ncbi:hypothetical protein [Aquisphaera insulae]|uniref:hypothetical protein n=1 Tax=Aquisphaera insulae TaxID=2712864 RepID=UPI0013EBFB28|nr:hypothetical protein [Aquisphaera insulae]
MRTLIATIGLVLIFGPASPGRGDAVFDLGEATLTIRDSGAAARVTFADGTNWPIGDVPAFLLGTGTGDVPARSVARDGRNLKVTFEDGSTALFRVEARPGLAVFRLETLESRRTVERFRLFRLAVPADATIGATLNAAHAGGRSAAVMIAEPNMMVSQDAAPARDGRPIRGLEVATARRFGITPAAFGVVAVPTAEFLDAVRRFEEAAGLPSPHVDGVWNKVSPGIRRSYLFLTDFRESQFDRGLALAKRGGFDRILLGQESWSLGTGHYTINRERFPDGLDGLKRTIARFRAEGFKVGLHFLSSSIYPPDPYITPVPDKRLVLGARTTLAADIDEKAGFIPSLTAPSGFPAKDGGYEGNGTVLRIDDEIIAYESLATAAPFGFVNCRRGALGTRAVPHAAGATVANLRRAYGYHMYDLDTSLCTEVATNFARVADACGVEMVYFDGSESLQGEHWYYNAIEHKAFFDALRNKNILLQASSYSPYSWHIQGRTASADGHGDLKGYLDERSPGFDPAGREWMPLDIGWYYGYDPNATLDQYEYILGATIGYDSSLSYQVSVAAASDHPFTQPVLDLIARYERLRLSGRVPAAMKERLRIPPALRGRKPDASRDDLLTERHEYRLVGEEGHEAFQRITYGAWHEIATSSEAEKTWTVKVAEGPARLGAWIHVKPGPWLKAGPSYTAADALLIEGFDDVSPYVARSTSPDVAQQFEVREDDAREGRRYAVLAATSTRSMPDGWTYASRTFEKPLDLSWHRGLGLWLRGDGRGGLFKLQLRDGSDRAMDHYVPNDFHGWRYQQLGRPATDAIDYHAVKSLSFYYNGLPAGAAVSCGVDGVKALRSLDRQVLTDPWVEIGGRRLTWRGEVEAGQYLAMTPGEPITRYGLPLAGPERSAAITPDFFVPAGEYTVRVGSQDGARQPVRVGVVYTTSERHEVP